MALRLQFARGDYVRTGGGISGQRAEKKTAVVSFSSAALKLEFDRTKVYLQAGGSSVKPSVINEALDTT